MDRYLIDTNVLLRATVPSLADHSIALAAVAELAARGNHLFLAPQTIIEFWVVATRPTDVNGLGWPASQAMLEVERILGEFPLLDERPTIFELWLYLINQHGIVGKSAHDARLVAFMSLHGLSHLLTFNKGHFARYALHVVSPNEVVATP